MLSIDYTIDDHTSSYIKSTQTDDSQRFAVAVNRKFVIDDPQPKPNWERFNTSFVNEQLTIDELADAVRSGYSITAPHGKRRHGDNWQCTQVLCTDHDEGGDIADVMDDRFVWDHAAFLHTTKRHTEHKPRCRVVYVLDEPITDPLFASNAAKALIWRSSLPADESCKDVARLFYGSKGCHVEMVGELLPVSILRKLVDEYLASSAPLSANADTYTLDVDPDATGDDLLAAAIEQASDGERNNKGFLLASGLRDRGISQDDAKGYMLAYQKAVTERRNPYTVQEALQSLRSAYSRPARELPSVADRIAFHEDVLKAQSFWLSAEGAETLVSVGVTKDSGQAIVTALLDIMAEWGRPDVWPGLRTWADVAGVALSTLQKHSERLIEAGIIAREAPKDEGAAFTFTVDLHYRYTPPEVLQTDATAKQHLPSLHTVPILSFYSEHRTDDAFRNNHAAYKRRKPNGLDPLGRTALIVAFRLLDGAATVREIAAATGRNEQTIRRALKRAFDYGLLTFATERHNTRRYELLPEWLDDLKTLRRQMTTYGVQFEREYQTAEKALAWALKRKASPKRIAALQAKVNRYAKAEGWDGDDPASWVLFRRSARTWQRWDTAERDRDLAQVRDEVQRLTLGGCDVSAIMRMLTMGGYEAADVSRALVARSQSQTIPEYAKSDVLEGTL